MSVVLCTWGNTIEGGTAEALTLAHKLSVAARSELNWVVIGSAGDNASELAAKYGVARLDRISDADFGAVGEAPTQG